MKIGAFVWVRNSYLALITYTQKKKKNFSYGIYKLVELKMMYKVYKRHQSNILIESELDVFSGINGKVNAILK